jgi:hypothetical protein
MTSLLERDAAWCNANLGKSLGDLPERPADNRCELSGWVVKRKLRPDFDPELQRLGLPPEECFRGWVSDSSMSLIKWTYYVVGEKKLFDYLTRCAAPPCPADGLCELCGKMPATKLHHDHVHELEDCFTLEGSRRGWLCGGCNTSKIARIDAIGIKKFRDYLRRARARRKMVSMTSDRKARSAA